MQHSLNVFAEKAGPLPELIGLSAKQARYGVYARGVLLLAVPELYALKGHIDIAGYWIDLFKRKSR